MQLP
ncbi:uncharacterized protein FFC1_12646 [Fusarium fujikuroi]|jgi:hypothetical protein